MAFHVTCWETKFGRTTTRKFPARYAGKCEVCGGPIAVGEVMTWSRRGKANGTTSNGTTTNAGDVTFADVTSSDESSAHVPPFPPEPTNGDSIIRALINLPALAGLLAPMLEDLLDLEGAATAPRPVTVTVKAPDGTSTDVGLQHKSFPTLLAACAARCNVWIAGPAGSGKTTAAQNVASALGLPFYYTGAVGDPFQIVGFVDASGRYSEPPIYKAYKHGGVFLWDEVDGSDPNALLAFNALLANGKAVFPNGEIVDKHADCIIIAAANTYGLGATAEYVGRNRLDAAFLDRFVQLDWPYDTDLEMAVSPNLGWTARVQAVRAAVAKKGLRVMITPRASIYGAALLSQGMDPKIVESMTLAKAMTPDQWSSIVADVGEIQVK